MNLPPELTVRIKGIDDLLAAVILGKTPLSYIVTQFPAAEGHRPLTEYFDKINQARILLGQLAEPLHNEIEELKAQLAEAKKAVEDQDDQRTERIMHQVFMDSLLDDLGAPKHPDNDPNRPKYGPYGRLRAYAESIGIKATMWEPFPKLPTS